MTPSELIEKSNELFTLGEQIQGGNLDEEARRVNLRELENAYRLWYRQSLPLFAKHKRPDLEKLFVKEYQGSWISQKIERFLTTGWKIYQYYDPDKPSPIIPKWTVTYERSFKAPLEKQIDYLSMLQ